MRGARGTVAQDDRCGDTARRMAQRGRAAAPVDELQGHGREDPPVAMGRDLTALQHALGARAAATFASLPTIAFDRERVTECDFGDLPTQRGGARRGARRAGYPA